MARLTVAVRNAPEPNGRVVSADPALAYLRQLSLVTSRVTLGWEISDTVIVRNTPRGDVGVRIESREGEPLASVALVSMGDEAFGASFEAGMCRIKVAD